MLPVSLLDLLYLYYDLQNLILLIDDGRNEEQNVFSKALPEEDATLMLYVAIGVAVGVLLLSLAAASCFLCPKHNLCRQEPSR